MIMARSLVYHALGCQQDPTENNVLLYEHGDEDCWADATIDSDALFQQNQGEIENPVHRPGHIRIKLRTATGTPVASTNE